MDWDITEPTMKLIEEVDSYWDYDSEEVMHYPVPYVLNQLQNSSFKGAVLMFDSVTSSLNYLKPLNERQIFNRLEEKFITYPVGIILPNQKDFLHTTFKRKINQLIHGGFFNLWMDLYMKHRSFNEKIEEETRIVLTMDHLSVGFIIWLAMLMIALCTAIAELARFHITKYFHRRMFEIVNERHQY